MQCYPMQAGANPSTERQVADDSAAGADLLPVDRPGAQHVGAERAAEQLLRRARGLDQRREVDPGLDPHLVQHRDQVLGRDVAGRARRDRAAAELAEARLERVDSLLERREHVGEALAAGVVEVRGQLDPGRAARARRRRTRATWRGFAIPVVSPKPTSSQPAAARRSAISNTRSGGTSPS